VLTVVNIYSTVYCFDLTSYHYLIIDYY